MASIIVKSEGGLFPHTHTLEIPGEALSTPRADGVLLKTSLEYSLIFKHGHEVRLSQEDLKKIAAGESIVARDTDKGRHSFRVQKN